MSKTTVPSKPLEPPPLPDVSAAAPTSKRTLPPIVNLQIYNPVTYIKYWWKRVVANEGVDLRFRIRPLTAIAITVAISGSGFFVGRITFPAGSPIVKYVPQLGPSPTPNPWQDTAFSGILRLASGKYYLAVSDALAINLEVPTNINLAKYVGRRIFATGLYNRTTNILHVTNASDLEILPTQAISIPTLPPSSTPVPPSPTPASIILPPNPVE